MAKQQSRKPAKDVNKIGASEANQPTRKDEHKLRQPRPEGRPFPAGAICLVWAL